MNRKGFSLIEVLVATALLVMVVGMIGFVFRQSSMSWDSGIRRAEGTTQIRAVIGAIERDLRSAVDAREFGMKNDFGKSSATFVALLEPEDMDERVPVQVSYTIGDKVTRKASVLSYSSGSWSASGGGDSAELLENDSADAVIHFEFDPVSGDDKDGLPAYVTIRAELTTVDKFSNFKVISFGRDGKENTRDDIVLQ